MARKLFALAWLNRTSIWEHLLAELDYARNGHSVGALVCLFPGDAHETDTSDNRFVCLAVHATFLITVHLSLRTLSSSGDNADGEAISGGPKLICPLHLWLSHCVAFDSVLSFPTLCTHKNAALYFAQSGNCPVALPANSGRHSWANSASNDAPMFICLYLPITGHCSALHLISLVIWVARAHIPNLPILPLSKAWEMRALLLFSSVRLHLICPLRPIALLL